MKILKALPPLLCTLLPLSHLDAADVEVVYDVTPGGVTTPDWNVNGVIEVGASAFSVGHVEISGVGSVSSNEAVIGAGNLSNASATVRGQGIWTTTGEFVVGKGGVGTLSISGDGEVNAGSMRIGSGATGTVNVVDRGVLEIGGTLAVGSGGSGTLTIGGSASVDVTGDLSLAERLVGHVGNITGLVEVSGGTLNAGTLYLANTRVPSLNPLDHSEGTLRMSGGNVSVAAVGLGEVTGTSAKGNLQVSAGSLTIDGDLNLIEVNGSGPGVNFHNSISLNLSGSGVVNNRNGVIAASLGSVREMSMTGGIWNNSGSLTLGYFEGVATAPTPLPQAMGGSVRLELSGTASIHSVGGTIVGDSTVIMNGGSWTNSGKLMITDGKMEIHHGTVTSASAELAGGALVEVAGGSWINATTLRIGAAGQTNFKVTDGEVSTAATGLFGKAEVSGGSFITTGELSIGYVLEGASLQISGEGEVTSGHAVVGDYLSTASASISGGLWSTGKLTVGDRGGNGTLEISDSARVIASEGVTISGLTAITEIAGNVLPEPVVVPATGALHLNGGILETPHITKLGAAGTVNFNGTTVRARQAQAEFLSGFSSGDLMIGAGGAIFDSNGFNIGIASTLSGSGGIVKKGAGVLLLSGSHLYTGGVTLEAGTLQLGNAAALGMTPSRVAVEGGVLDLNGLNVTLGTLSGQAGGVIRTGVAGDRDLTLDQSGSAVFAGRIEDGAGRISLVTTGTGTLQLTGANSYSGGTRLLQGAIELSGAGTLGSGFVAISGASSTSIGATISFLDTANAGSLTYIASGALENGMFGGTMVFRGTSSAGSAKLVANAGTNGGRGGIISFTHQADGASSQVELYGNGRLTISSEHVGPVSIGSLSGDGEVRLGAYHLAIGANHLETTFSGLIDGSGSIGKVGTGKLTFSGFNSYSGGTEVKSGVLALSGAGTLGSGATTVSSEALLLFTHAANAGTLTYTASGATTSGDDGGAITLEGTASAGSAKLIASGGSNGGGGGVISLNGHSDGGTAQVELNGNGRLTVASHSAASVAIGSLAGDGLVSLGSKNLMLGVNNLNTTFAGAISGTGSLTKVGTGTLTVTGINSYTGGTHLNKGEIEVTGGGGLGSGTLTVAAGTLPQIEAALLFKGSADAGSGTYVNEGATVLGAFGGVTGFYNDASAGEARLVAHGGSGGGSGGMIAFVDASDGGTSQVELDGNGQLTIATHSGGHVQIGSLSGNGRVTLGAHHLAIGANHLSTTFAGSFSDSGSISKVGTGTLTLSGQSNFSGGTEIKEGTLVIADVGAGNSVLGTGEVVVGVGGRLSGVGSVLGDTTVAGRLAPGNSPGTIHFGGALTLDSTAVVEMELSEVLSDRISVGALLTYDGTLAITLSGGFLPLEGATFDLFDAALVADGSQFEVITFNVAGYGGVMNYETGVLTIASIPEPSVMMLSATAFLAMAGWRRLRNIFNRGDGVHDAVA